MRTKHSFVAHALSVGVVLASAMLPAYAADSLATANAALQAGKADEATKLLQDALHSDAKNAEANNLLCRVEYSLQQWNDAAGHCEKAVTLKPGDARYHLWLGRAFGEKADHVSFISAYSLAKRAREEFETAVKLDPHDADALSDLGEFYKEAPGAVGGGIDKAQGIAKQLDAVDPARAHNLRGEIAEKQKDLDAAEKEFKAATTGPGAALQWMELANFYRRHERWSDMEAAIKSGQAAAGHDKYGALALFNGASILARTNRQPQLAIKLFTEYIASPDKTEDAPAFDALARLARLRKSTGDNAGAERDKASALDLAKNYKPAQDATSDAKGK
ncbi:tetratricopeptide repeat protein [Acidicapsa ligni]|uniref:tetratricopeptide repeat protein n=1 Tax=Acidicapsa ligni TaxID=542300 RepID=UPI0021DF88B4|nr:tetratricopeptide repeat protein [Acidicapsa ligni]